MTPNTVLTVRNLNSAVYFHNKLTYGVCLVCPGTTQCLKIWYIVSFFKCVILSRVYLLIGGEFG